MKYYLLKLPEELHTRIKVLAAESNVTMQDYINVLLKSHVDKVDKAIKKN